MTSFSCPYLSGEVELSSEREHHIGESHPDLLPEHRDRIAETLASPDQVRISQRLKNARLFSRRFDSIRGGNYVVVVMVSEGDTDRRHWIITAYIARKLAGGEIEWKRN